MDNFYTCKESSIIRFPDTPNKTQLQAHATQVFLFKHALGFETWILELMIEYGTFPQGPVFKLSPPLERVWGGGDLTHNGQ